MIKNELVALFHKVTQEPRFLWFPQPSTVAALFSTVVTNNVTVDIHT